MLCLTQADSTVRMMSSQWSSFTFLKVSARVPAFSMLCQHTG